MNTIGPREAGNDCGQPTSTWAVTNPNGEEIALIEMESMDAGTGMAREWRTTGYTVTIWADVPSRGFDVPEYGTARKALAAAKQWARNWTPPAA